MNDIVDFYDKTCLVSIIVPIYNSEKYLKRCLNSIKEQTFEDMEVLLVDDGSTDNSQKICYKFVESSNKFKYFYKENGGISDARNFGIKHALGKYICFVDSDDYISSQMIEMLFKAIQENKTLMSLCGYYMCNKQEKKSFVYNEKSLITPYDFLKSVLNDSLIGSYSWNKMYEKSLFEKIEYPVGHKYEDISITYKLIELCDFVAVVQTPLYYYIRHDDSITGGLNVSNLKDELNALITRNNYIINNYASLKKKAQCQLVKYSIVIWNQYAKSGDESYVKEMNEIREYIIKHKNELSVREIKYQIMRIAIQYLQPIYKRVVYKSK